MNKENSLRQILDKTVDHKKIFGTSFCIKYHGETWCGSSGNLRSDSPYFIASTTKLFVTATILNLVSKGELHLGDKIGKYLDRKTLKGLHISKGKEYSDEISLRQLLAHTSGLPDYFQGKNDRGNSLEKDITGGNDRSWTFEQAIEYSKAMKPHFSPGQKGRAHYSDTNFQLLGKIITTVTGKSLSAVFQELLFQPAGLLKTYLYQDVADTTPQTLYFKSSELPVPGAMASFGADGGAVSTSEEMLVFLEAFFGGRFFPEKYISTLKVWNRIFFPMQAGIGIHRFKLPWFFDPFGFVPELIGHSGLSGALAYYSPEKDLYLAGTVNQVAYPDLSFRLAIKLIREITGK